MIKGVDSTVNNLIFFIKQFLCLFHPGYLIRAAHKLRMQFIKRRSRLHPAFVIRIKHRFIPCQEIPPGADFSVFHQRKKVIQAGDQVVGMLDTRSLFRHFLIGIERKQVR